MLRGYATEEGTRRYGERHTGLRYKELGKTGLKVSELGFGTYRVDINVDSHILSLREALRGGINIIDTSSNYTNGDSERLICDVLNKLIEEGDISRDEVVIVSKGGYIQGDNYEISQNRKKEGRGYAEVVEYGEGLEHCISPDFLKDQITMSLMRLGVSTIDIYLLHNPEYYLGHASKVGKALEGARGVYYERIERAFKYLEGEVKEGRIRSYGISSNTFAKDEGNMYEATSLKKVYELAKRVCGKDNNFKVVQFPMNIFESDAGHLGVVKGNGVTDGSDKTLLSYISENGLGSLINRPLNALVGNSIVRLADVSIDGKVVREEKTDKYIEDMLELEKKFKTTYIRTLEDVDEKTKEQLTKYLLIGEVLKSNWRNFINYTQWYDVFNNYFTPRVNSGVHYLSNKELSVAFSYWVDNYVDSINRVFSAIDLYYKIEADKNNRKIKEVLRGELEEFVGKRPPNKLSQMSVYALRHSAGIGSVLVGMRNELYVKDMLEGLKGYGVEQKESKEFWRVVNKKLSFVK